MPRAYIGLPWPKKITGNCLSVAFTFSAKAFNGSRLFIIVKPKVVYFIKFLRLISFFNIIRFKCNNSLFAVKEGSKYTVLSFQRKYF